MTFWSYRKNGLIRKVWLISKFMKSKLGWQTFVIHILPNISLIKDNQAMNLSQLVEYKNRSIFLQKSCRKWGRETSSRSLFCFLKGFIEVKSRCFAVYFQYTLIALNLAYNKNKLYKTLDYWFRDLLNFDFFRKGSWY